MTELLPEERWVGVKEASEAWTAAAVEVLSEVAGHYLGVITYAELAEQVQARTGLRTRVSFRSWIGTLLGAAVVRCRAQGLPPLTSLVVHSQTAAAGADETTAAARLTCYRHFATDVPVEVIVAADAAARAKEAEAKEAAPARRSTTRPSTTRRSTASRATTGPRGTGGRRRSAADEAPRICPTCFVQLPASGICDECG